MPFYEYECPHCAYHGEVLQKISDKPLRRCPNCGKSGLKKLMSAPVFRLKGSGWYETDFKSDKEEKRNLAVDKEEPKAEDKKETKPDAAKPEAKPEAAKSDAPKPADAKPAPVRKRPTRAKPKVKARPAKRSRR